MVEDIVLKIEMYLNGLIDRATGGQMMDQDYTDFRNLLLSINAISELVPRFMKTCRSVSDFWQFIKAERGTYDERRRYLKEQFDPIMNYFEITVSAPISLLDLDYEKCERLGLGGFGEVFRYHNKLLDLDFAVKFFKPSFPIDEQRDLTRFFQEAKILFELEHKNITRIYDVGIQGKEPFIRMEYIDGLDLNKILIKQGSIHPKKCIELVFEVSQALEYAHSRIVHRDLKPSNIMVAEPNKYKVIDFGLGIYKEKELVSRITKLDEGLGGSLYTSPELHHNPFLIDKRSDIYSLGAIWYAMLTGKPPSGMNVKKNLKAMGIIADKYLDVVINCLEDIDNRYSNFSELITDIQKNKLQNGD